MKLTVKQKIAVIFVLALAIRLLFGLGFYLQHQSYVSYTGDAADYINTAQNFLRAGVWSASPINPEPDNFRAPIYPLFLALFYKFNIPLDFVGVIQDLIMAASAVFIYILGRKLFSEAIAFWAAVFIALDPYLASSFVSHAIMTEAFVIFFLVLALFSLGIYITHKKPAHLYYGAVWLALAALTKPQFFWFGIFIFIAVILAGECRAVKKFVLASLIFLALLSPWLYYNFMILKVPQFSSNPLAALYQDAGFFQEWLAGRHGPAYNDYTWDTAKKRLGVDYVPQLFEPHRAEILAKSAVEFIMKKPLWFVYYHLTRLPRIFWQDTTIESIVQDFNMQNSKIVGADSDINIIKDVLAGRFSVSWGQLRAHPVYLASLAIKLMVLIISLLAIFNFGLQWKLSGRISKISLFFCLFIILYAAVVSPLGQHRYRAPIYPLLVILAFDSIRLVYPKMRKCVFTKAEL